MADPTAREPLPGPTPAKGPLLQLSPDSQHDGNDTTDDDATVCGLEDGHPTSSPGLSSGSSHPPRAPSDGGSPVPNGAIQAKAPQGVPPDYPPPPPTAPSKTPPLSSPSDGAKPSSNGTLPLPSSGQLRSPSPPPSEPNGVASPADHPSISQRPLSPPQSSSSPPTHSTHTPPQSGMALTVLAPSREHGEGSKDIGGPTNNKTLDGVSGPGDDSRVGRTPQRSASEASTVPALPNFVPPPPPPALSPSLPSLSSSDESDRLMIHAPVPRTPSKPFGRIRTEMENYRQLRGDDYSSEEEEVPQRASLPPIYPARTREESRTRAATDADVAREITSTMARLQERNSQDEAISGKIGGRDVRDLWGELRRKREDIYAMRLEMTRDRKALRDLRHRKNDADNKMLSMIRRVLPKLGNENRRSFADAQALRTEYTTHENNYESRELALDSLEAELLLLETKFFTGLSHRAGADGDRQGSPRTPSPPLDDADVPLELKGISPDGPQEVTHPLYKRFQDAVGDFNLASENWHDLLSARAGIDFKLTIDKHLGMERLEEEEIEFLDEFPEEETRRSEELQEARGTVERLRDVCVEQHVMRRHPPLHILYVLYKHFPMSEDEDENDLGEDIDLSDGPPSQLVREKRARPFLWRLMSQEAHLFGKTPVLPPAALEAARKLPPDHAQREARIRDAEEEQFLHGIFSDCPAHNPAAFVNRWLFHQLRISPHMGHLLYNMEDEDAELDILAWQEHVLGAWWDEDVPPAGPVEKSEGAVILSGVRDYSSG